MVPRNARPVILVTFLGFLILLFWGPPLSGSTHYYRDLYDGWRAPGAPPLTLVARLRQEELRYEATLKARKGLIERYGPEKEQVKA